MLDWLLGQKSPKASEKRKYVFVAREVVTKYYAIPAFDGNGPRIEYVDETIKRVEVATEETDHVYRPYDRIYLNGEYEYIKSVERSPDLGAYVVELNRVLKMTRDEESYEKAQETLKKYQAKHVEEVRLKYER